MSIFAVRRRVACYITRAGAGGLELLVFDHVDDDPADPSGVQIPAGGMLAFEGIEQASLRETAEETGLTTVTYEGQVGAQERGLDDPDGPTMTTYVHLVAVAAGPDQWLHTVTTLHPAALDASAAPADVAEDEGLVFGCRWVPLPLGEPLADGQDEFLNLLPDA